MHTHSTNQQVASGRKKETCSNMCLCLVCVAAATGAPRRVGTWEEGVATCLLHNRLASGMVWFSGVDMLYLCCIAGWEEDAYDIRRVHDTFSQR